MELIDKSKGGRGCHCVFFLLSEKSLIAKWLILERIKKEDYWTAEENTEYNMG